MGVQSHFHVKPKLRLGYVELRLGWGFDNIQLQLLLAVCLAFLCMVNPFWF